MDHLLEARQARLGNNQAPFRAANEEMETLSRDGLTGSPVGFVCECANPECGSQPPVALDEYEVIRQNSTRFFVLPDHVFGDVETVVDDRGRYVIVERFGAGAQVAAATDGRGSAP